MRSSALLLYSAALMGLVTGGCVTDVCRISSPQVELVVTFSDFDLSAATTLEVDSAVKGPVPDNGSLSYSNRRVDRLPFPEGARTGKETFLLDPGAYIYGLRDREEVFDWTIHMRVFDASGRLLAEGSYVMTQASTSGCYLAHKMTVSGIPTCVGKQEGDPCVASANSPRVCKGDGSLTCDDSTCGDGFVDLRQGELCDPALPVDGVACHPTSCLPAPVETVLTDGKAQWNELLIESPPARKEAAAATVQRSGEELALMFGGEDADGDPMADMWAFDGVAWTEVTSSATAPSPRAEHAMAWDPERGILVLFGGRDATGMALGDTWVFDPEPGGGWQLDIDASNIPALLGHAMAFDPGRHAVLLYGGHTSSGANGVGSVWAYTPAQGWEVAYDTVGSSRYNHTITYVPALDALVALGGLLAPSGSGLANEMVVLTSDGPQTISYSATGLTRRTDHSALWSDSLDRLLVFGGFDRTNPSSPPGLVLRSTETCAATSTTPTCSNLGSPDTPHGRRGHVMFQLGTSVYVFAGEGSRASGESFSPVELLSDTWELTTTIEPRSEIALKQGMLGTVPDDSVAFGLHALGTEDSSSADVDRACAMLVADLDGDGFDEIAVGWPGSRCQSVSGDTCGRVSIKDSRVRDTVVNDLENDMLTILGAQSPGKKHSWLGASLAAGRLDGDAARDLVVGAPNAEQGEGAVYVIFGGSPVLPVGTKGSTVEIDKPLDRKRYAAFTAPTAGAQGRLMRLGAAVATGDFDGDGLEDLVASAPIEDGDGVRSSVYAVQGGSSWPTGDTPASISESAGLTITSDTPGLWLGYALGAGDLDGDGYTDLVVGSAAPAGTDSPAYGAVAVIFGGEGFFARAEAVINIQQMDPEDGLLIAAPSPSDRLGGLGGVVATVDLDGDGADELVTSLGRPDRSLGEPGAVALFAGADLKALRAGEITAPTLMDRATVLSGPSGAGFGASLAVGDTNGDLLMDLIISAPYQDGPATEGRAARPEAGAVYVVLASQRASYFLTPDTSVADLQAVDVSSEEVSIPLLIVRGNESYGFFGSAVATSSHLVSADPLVPHPYTMVFQPGWFDGDSQQERNLGRVWTLYLARLLGCGSQAPCPLP